MSHSICLTEHLSFVYFYLYVLSLKAKACFSDLVKTGEDKTPSLLMYIEPDLTPCLNELKRLGFCKCIPPVAFKECEENCLSYYKKIIHYFYGDESLPGTDKINALKELRNNTDYLDKEINVAQSIGCENFDFQDRHYEYLLYELNAIFDSDEFIVKQYSYIKPYLFHILSSLSASGIEERNPYKEFNDDTPILTINTFRLATTPIKQYLNINDNSISFIDNINKRIEFKEVAKRQIEYVTTCLTRNKII